MVSYIGYGISEEFGMFTLKQIGHFDLFPAINKDGVFGL